MIHDLSDRGLVEQFGDIMHELPELYQALRTFELQNRPITTSGGFRIRGDGMSVQRLGDVTRIRVGDTRSKE